jgi:hypothetical protein
MTALGWSKILDWITYNAHSYTNYPSGQKGGPKIMQGQFD